MIQINRHELVFEKISSSSDFELSFFNNTYNNKQ